MGKDEFGLGNCTFPILGFADPRSNSDPMSNQQTQVARGRRTNGNAPLRRLEKIRAGIFVPCSKELRNLQISYKLTR